MLSRSVLYEIVSEHQMRVHGLRNCSRGKNVSAAVVEFGRRFLYAKANCIKNASILVRVVSNERIKFISSNAY